LREVDVFKFFVAHNYSILGLLDNRGSLGSLRSLSTTK